MTTERIDHAAEAENNLASLKAWDTYTHEPIVLKAAHVHATLALVEQQRLGNLLAWIEVDEGNGIDARFKRNLYRSDIKKGLGIS